MLNSGKHFLSGLLNRFSSRHGNRSWFSKGSVDHLRTRHLSLEPLEDRQLLAVSAAEMTSLAGTYSALGMSASDNFIEIVNTKLNLQELQTAINTAANTSANDVIVLRTTTQAFTLDLGNSPLTIDVPTSKGNLCIISVGEQPLRLTAQSSTVLSIDSGTIGLGNVTLVGDQVAGTELPLITTATSAVLSTQKVNFTVQNYWTKSLANGGDAYITLCNGVYSVDWALNNTTDLRSYVTGLQTMSQVNDLLGLDYTQSDPVFDVDTNYIDADINDTYGIDSNLMWAGSAADLLNYTGWGHVVSSSEDGVYQYFVSNFTNDKYYVEGAVQWFMNGQVGSYGNTYNAVLDDKGNVVTAASNDTWASIVSDGGNLYGETYKFSDYGGTFDSSTYYSSNASTSPLKSVAEMLKAGYGIATNLSSYITKSTAVTTEVFINGQSQGVSDPVYQPNEYDYRFATNALTIWGYVYDSTKTATEPGYYISIYATDPSDDKTGTNSPNKLEKYDISWITTTDKRYGLYYTYSVPSLTTSISADPVVSDSAITTSTTGTQTWTRTTTTVTTTTDYRMKSYVYLAMAEGYAPVAQDAYEPNNSAADVDARTDIDSSTNPSPNLGIINGQKTIENLTLVDPDVDPVDWFKFQTNQSCSIADKVAVEYETTLFSGHLSLYLYTRDADGKLVWLEDRVFTRETLTSTDISGNGTNSYRVSISLSGLASGTYYVVVNRTDAAVDCKNYKLAIQTCSDDRYEVNNTRAEVDAFPEGGVDSPNLGPIFAPDDSSAEVEMELSGLVLKQASPNAISTSEVDAFRFVMTGVGGPNSYIEIQYDNTRYNPNDADLDMYLYSWSGEEYYRQYPGAWGDLVASSIRNEKEGVERISLDGLPAGIYYVKIVGFVNSENILDYKLVFHMRDETDPPGVGVTTDPDYYTTKPNTEEVPYEWESPLVVTSDQYSTYNPEKSGSDKFSGGTLFYSQDKIYYNLSFAVTGRKDDTVEVGYYLNGTLVGTETVPFQVGESTAILTDRALARLTNEHILNASDGSLWEGTEAFDFAFKDGMILSVIDSQNFVTSGYVYMNGNFVAISDTVELANAESLTLADGTKVVYYKQTLIESGLTNVVTKTSTVKSLTGTSVPLTFVSKNESYAVSYNSNTRVFSITIPGGSQEVTFKSGSVFVYGSTYLTYVNSGTQDLFYISNVNSTAETKSTTYDGVFRSYVSEYITGSSIALTMLTATGSRSVTYNSSQDKFVDSSGTVTVASGTVFSYYDVAADETSYLTYVPRYFTGATNAMTMIAADGTESLVNFNAERNSFTSNNSAITVTAGTKFYYTDDTGERVNMTYYKNGRFIVFFDSYVDLTKLGESKVGDVIDVSGRTLTTDEGVSLYYDYAQQEFYVLTSMANGTVMTYTEGTETTTLYYQGIYLSKTSAALYKGYEIGDALMLRSAPDTFNTNLSYNGTLLSYSNGSFYKKGTTQKVNIALGTILTWTDPADSTNTRGVLYNTDPSGNTTNKGLYVSLDNPLDDGAIVNVGTDEFMFRDSNFYAEYGEVTDGTRLLFDSGTVAQTDVIYNKQANTFTAVSSYPATITTESGDLLTWYNGKFSKTYENNNAAAFFADGTRFVFYTDKDTQGTSLGIGTSYIKVTPSKVATTADYALYANTFSFAVDYDDAIKEYVETNNTSSSTFNVFRYQDDHFIPNATLDQALNSTNPTSYLDNPSDDPNVKYNPNLGPIIGEAYIDNLALMTTADWFTFEIQGDTSADNYVQITFDKTLGDLDLYVYKVDTNYSEGYFQVGFSASTGNTEKVSLAGQNDGLYYVKVVGFRGTTNPYYNMTIIGSEPISVADKELEATAKPINTSAVISWNLKGASEEYVFGGPEEYFAGTEIMYWKEGQTAANAITVTAARYADFYTLTGLDLPQNPGEKSVYHYQVRAYNTNSDEALRYTPWTTDQTFSIDYSLNAANYYALIIGASDYVSYDQLSIAVGDANGVYDALIKAAPQWSAGNITKLTGSVTKDDITVALQDMTQGKNAPGENDVVFVYYVGRGSTKNIAGEVTSYINTYGDTYTQTEFATLLDNYFGNVAQLDVVLNPYYFQSGSTNDAFNYTGFGDKIVDAFADSNTTVSVITAANNGENTRVDENGDDFFGSFLVDSLGDQVDGVYVADANHDGRVSIQEIYDYVNNNVSNETSTLQNPQFIPQNQTKDTIVIKGDWREDDNNYEYFADAWWKAGGVVVTTQNDVVDVTDGEISLREAVDILGTTLVDQTILTEGTKIVLEGEEESTTFVYAQNLVAPGQNFSIGDVEYTYRDGLRYTLLGQPVIVQDGDQFIWTHQKTLNTGLVTIIEEVTAYRDASGYFRFKNAQGTDVDPYLNVTGNSVSMTLADGSNTKITLTRCGLKDQALTLDTIVFDGSLVGKTFELDLALTITNDKFTKDDGSTIDSITVNGNSLDGGVHIVPNGDFSSLVVKSDNAADKVVSLLGLVLTDGTVAGGALANESGNVYLINSLVYNNTAGVAITNNAGAELHITNSTISANAGGIANQGNLVVANSILYDDPTNTTVQDISGTGTKTVNYSLVGSGHTYTQGTGNLNPADITLATVFTSYDTRDFTLVAESKVINAASAPLAVDANGLQLSGDLAGNARKLYGGVDMGAYEWYDPTLSVSTVVTTMYEDYVVDEVVVSLREAISYAGSWYKSVKTLTSLEGQTFTINSTSNIYAESGAFVTHQSGYFVMVNGSPIELRSGDRLKNVATGQIITFTGSSFKDAAGNTVAAPAHRENVLYYTSDSTYVAANYRAYLSVAFTDYKNGDSITCNADGMTGTIIVADDGTVSVSKTVVLGNTIHFDMAAMKNDWLARNRDKSEADWYDMIGTDGVVFNLDSYASNVLAGPIVIDTNVTIDGANTQNGTAPSAGFFVTPAANNTAFVIDVTSAVQTVTFNHFNFTGANLTAGNGGQMLVRNGDVMIANAMFSNNKAVSGGAIYVQGGSVTIDATSLYENSATNGGAIAIGPEGTVTVNNSVAVFDNAATGNGGAIYNEGTLTMTGFSSKPVVFYGNMAAKGGAIYNTGTFTAKYVNSFNKDETDITKAGNLATQAGGFLYNATGASATINNSKIYYNYATTEETLADTNYTGQGGGIYNAGGLVLFASDLGGNRAASGGAVYDAATAGSANGYSTSVVNSVIRGNYAADNGGALYANSAPIYVYFSTIAGNRANNGGGVYVNSNTGAKLMLENSVVANNWWVTKSSDIYTADSQAVVASYSFVSIGDTQWNRESSVIGSMSTPANPMFVAMSHDVVTDILGWKNWTLSSMSSQIVAKGNAKSAESKLYYLSLTGKSITIAYDFTGLRNRRILSAEGIYVTDMGAYETGEQKETPSTKVTTLDYIFDETDGLISLYEAILYATNADYLRDFPSTCTTQITFDESLNGGTITVGNPLGDDKPGEVYSLIMDDSYEIYVEKGQNITLKGNGTSVLSVHAGANVTVTGLNITGGSAEKGGAINMEAGSLVLQDLCIFGNEAQKDGGAIYLSGGKLALIDVLISENTASSDVTYQMDTMGGAIRGVGGTLEIYGCTITQNEAPNYGGLYISDTNLIVYNTIMAENTDGIGYSGDFYCKGMKNNIFHSLIGIMKDAYIINGVNGNLAGTSLYPVEADMTYTPWSVSAEGKYTTPVVLLNNTSPAINAGDNSRVLYAEGNRIEFDLFGNPRILAGTVDMGVAESGVLDPIGTVVTTLEDVVDSNDGFLSIREAIRNAKEGDTVTFNISEEKLADNGGLYTIRLTGGAISLSGDKSITIDARENNGAQIQNGITIDAQSDSRVFSIDGTQNITLYNLVLTGGLAELGGAINSASTGQIELVNCVVYDNATEMNGPANRGGAIYLGAGTLKLLNSTVAANTTFSYGAIYAANSAKVILYNSIVSNNKNDVQDEDNNYDVFVASGNQSLEMVTSLVGSLPAAYAPSYLGSACVVGTFDSPVDAGFVVKPAFAANSPYHVVNLDGPTDLNLSSTSRAVNAGTNTLVGQPGYSSEISTDYRTYNTTVLNCDLAGNDRILYYTVDMGAYECTEEVSVKPSTIVTTLDDLADNPFDEVTTLREAIKNAGSTYIDQDGKIVTLGTTVTFDPKLLGGTINLTQGAVVIDKTVSVDASDLTGGITINAGGTSRVFEVLATTSAVAGQSDEIGLMGLRLTGGYAEVTQTSTIGGGAIYHTGGNLTIINSLLYDNEALKGGAIQSDGGTLKLVNVTITKNNAHDVTLPAEEDTPETTIKGGYGAIYSVNGDITFENTLVALNTYNATKTDGQWDTQASLTAQGRFSVEIFANTKLFKSSLVGVMRTVESIHGDKNGNLSGDPYNPLDPVFVDWDSNNFSLGRDTQNINSPAINAGQSEYAFDLDGNTILTDLTGSHRFVQQIDMGAFETALGTKEIPSTIVTTTSDVVNDMDGLISLREAINYAGTVGLGSTVTFMKSLTGKTFYLDSQLFIDKTVTIDGESLGTDITITLSDSVKDQGVIYINNGTVEMLNLVITNRYTARAKSGQSLSIANGGGIYVRMGSLFLYNCLLYDNYATNGAAIYVNPVPETVNLNIINTTITDNRCYSTGSTYMGAAVQTGNGIVNIQNSIIAKNQTAEAVKGTRILPQYSFLDYAPDVAKEEGHGMYGNYVGYDDIKEEMKKEAKKLFVDWANDDFHLTDASLATNSGKNTFTLFDNNGDISFYGLINASGVDLNGNRRLVGQTVDMGAYENQLAIDDYCWRDSADGYPIDEDSFNAMIEQSLTNSAAISRDVTALIATNPDADANDLLTTYRQQVATGKTAQSLLWYLRTYVQNYISSPTTGQAFDHLTFEQRVKIIDIYSETSYANEVISGHAAASVSVFRTWMNKWASGSDELALLDTLITSSSSTPLTTLLQLTSAAWDDSDLGKEKATLIEFIAPTGLPVADSLDDILAFTNKDVQTANYLRAFIQEYDAAQTNANKIIRNKMSGSVSRYEIYLYRLKDALEAVVGDDYSQAHKALGYLTIHGLDPDSRILVTTNLDTVTAQDGFISLREAVDRAERLYDIKISKPVEFATYSSVLTKNSTMVLGTQTISIERPITIDASMIDSFRINGNALNRIFMINTTAYPDEEVRLVNLELFNGYASSGGAIYHQGGNLVLINSLIHTNQAKYPSSAATTISYGGGIFSDAGCLTLVNCTVANNRADYGGGIYATPATTLFLYNTIIAKNAVNKAQSTTDVDIYVGSSSKLEMAYSFIGNCYSLAGRNETQGNIVGYGDDKSRDPYFVDINEGNFRLQPKIIRGDSSVDNPAAIGGNVAYVDYFNFVNDLDGHVIGYGVTEIQAERELQYLLDKGYDPDAGSAETRPYTELTETINDSRVNDMLGQRINVDITDQSATSLETLKAIYYDTSVPDSAISDKGGTIQMKDTSIVLLYYIALYKNNGEGQIPATTTVYTSKQSILNWFETRGYDTYKFNRNAENFNAATSSYTIGKDSYNSDYIDTLNASLNSVDKFLAFLEINKTRLINVAQITNLVNGLVDEAKNTGSPVTTVRNLSEAGWGKIGLGDQGGELYRDILATGATSLNELESFILEWNKENTVAQALKRRIAENSEDKNIADENKFVLNGTLYTRRLKDALLEIVNGPISMGAYQRTRETPSPIVTTAEDVVDPYDGLISLREAVLYATFSITEAVSTRENLEALSIGTRRTNRYNTYPDILTSGGAVPYTAVTTSLVGYQQSVSTHSFYSKDELIVNYWKITFADHLAGQTITLDSNLGAIDMYGFAKGFTTSSVFYYLIDASSINRLGGITIDANNINYIFNLHGYQNGALDQVQAVYAEFEGLKLTGASVAAIYMGAQTSAENDGEYCVAEVRNCLLYRNKSGIVIEDIVATKYYGVVHVFNSTIVNNTNDGINTAGKAFVYNSIVDLNGRNDVFLVYTVTQPTYREFTLYNSMYNTYGSTLAKITVSGTGLNNIRVSNPLFVDEANDDYRLATYSLAINTGNSDYLAINRPTHANAQTDLNGMERTQGGHVDMGCYENTYIVDQPSTVVTIADYYIDPDTGESIRDEDGNLIFNEDAAKAVNANATKVSGDIVDPTDGYISLREAIAYAEQFQYNSSNLRSGFPHLNTNEVTFDSLLKDAVITLTGGVINLVNDITINAKSLGTTGTDGFFQPGLTIDADRKSGIFYVDIANTKYKNTIADSKLNVNFYGLNLTGGLTAADGGAIYIASGNVLVEDSAIYGNEAMGHGGAIYIHNSGLVNDQLQLQRNELTIRGTRIAGNLASHYGGVASNQGVVRVEDSIIAENKARTAGADYDFYYYTISNANGYGSKNSVFGKTRNITLTGHGDKGDSNWLGMNDDAMWDASSQAEIDSIFTGEWDGNTWVGDATVGVNPLKEVSSTSAAVFAAVSDDDSFFDELLAEF